LASRWEILKDEGGEEGEWHDKDGSERRQDIPDSEGNPETTWNHNEQSKQPVSRKSDRKYK